MNHQQRALRDSSVEPLLLIGQGAAGTGKSWLIPILRRDLLKNSSHFAAQPGRAAGFIGGITVHNLLDIPMHKSQQVLGPEKLKVLQERFSKFTNRAATYIFVDERSLIGSNLLYYMNLRCKDATGSASLFGGMSIIMIGDICQLPPVLDSPIYIKRSSKTSSNIVMDAHKFHRQFNDVVIFQKQHRQSGNDPTVVEFREVLERLRLAECTKKDIAFLQKRCRSNIPVSEQKLFENELHMMYKNDEVGAHNAKQLLKLEMPIAEIHAKHDEDFGRNARLKQAGNLLPVIFLSVGSKVMLTWNRWQEAGLSNGLLGTVVGITYKKGHAPPELPAYVLVQFDEKDSSGEYIYKGPRLSPNLHPCTIPVSPVVKRFMMNRKFIYREQLSLGNSHAVTLHKGQGTNAYRIVCDMYQEEPNNAFGLFYTGASRVRKIEHIIFEDFDATRISNLSKSGAFIKRKEELDRLQILAEETKRRYENMPLPTVHTLENIDELKILEPEPYKFKEPAFTELPAIDYVFPQGFRYKATFMNTMKSLGITFRTPVEKTLSILRNDQETLKLIIDSDPEIFTRVWHKKLYNDAQDLWSELHPKPPENNVDLKDNPEILPDQPVDMSDEESNDLPVSNLNNDPMDIDSSDDEEYEQAQAKKRKVVHLHFV